MTDQWFYQQGEYEVGPLRPSELLEHVRKGIIRADTMVRKGNSSWSRASEVGGLFNAARKPTTVYLCPYCGSEVPKPPSYCTPCERHLDKANSKMRENRLPDDDPRATSDRGSNGSAWSNWLARLKR